MEKMNPENGAMSMPHTLNMEGRKRAKLTGVIAVSCFNEQEVVLETSEGELALLGEGLHIEQLNLEAGQLHVTGSIFGLEYSAKQTVKEKRGLFSRKRK